MYWPCTMSMLSMYYLHHVLLCTYYYHVLTMYYLLLCTYYHSVLTTQVREDRTTMCSLLLWLTTTLYLRHRYAKIAARRTVLTRDMVRVLGSG